MTGTRQPPPEAQRLVEMFGQNHELRAWGETRPEQVPGATSCEDPYRTVGVIGGGTAGFLTALALKTKYPHLEVTLVESTAIPIIGVGEASTPRLLPFLHHRCNIDVHEFYEEVRPTWKQGIRFVWGLPGDHEFHAPFDWWGNSLGVLRQLRRTGRTDGFTLQSLLMEHNVTAIIDMGGVPFSFLPMLPFAYHLENVRFVKYLTELSKRRGIGYLDRRIADVVLTEDGERVDHLTTHEGDRLSFDLYIDCTGFRSLLLGQALKTPFISYAGSLFTDRALVFSTDHGGVIDGYTTATTMRSGWTWTIPHEEKNNHGYVFCSAHCTPEQAEEEARAAFPGMGDVSDVVRFRSGRYAESWRGNVIAVGNAAGFVEPLESTGILMIGETIETLLALFPASRSDRSAQRAFNTYIGQHWDAFRWFLSVHYKFNRRLDTPFWQAARHDTDVSGIQPLLDAFRELAPLTFRSARAQAALGVQGETAFFGLAGYDCVLLGQQVECRLMDLVEEEASWQERWDTANQLVSVAMPTAAALKAVRDYPQMLDALVGSPRSWMSPNSGKWLSATPGRAM